MYFLEEVTGLAGEVMGEDWVYFSQPRTIFEAPGYPTRFFSSYTLTGTPGFALPRQIACLAGCTAVISIGAGASPQEGIPIRCGELATVDPRGRHLCAEHTRDHWECPTCDAHLAHGDGGFCSEACRAAYQEAMTAQLGDDEAAEER